MGLRKNQEDFIYPASGKATADSRLFVVCDGMGGYDKGEVASSTVANSIAGYMEQYSDTNAVVTDSIILDSINSAFDALDAAASQQQCEKMGTTLIMICLHRGGCTAAHIGDSRIYHLRPLTNEILYRSRDHSLVQQLYEMGEISYSEMKTSHQKNIIVRALQPHQDFRSKADLVHITDIRSGDYFYLCTDGMLEKMEEERLMEILTDKDTDDEQKRQLLINDTAGNADNHSAFLIHVERVEYEESDALQPNDEPQARASNKVLNDPERFIQPGDKEKMPMLTTIGNEQSGDGLQRHPALKSTTKKSYNVQGIFIPFLMTVVCSIGHMIWQV